MARQAGGACLLRIEDLDATRVRPEFYQGIQEDLAWLGLTWPEPVLVQSEHSARYEAALNRLAGLGVTYPCGCTRADIRAAQSAAQEGDPALPVYPGTCRGRPMADRGPGDAVRLDLEKALALVADTPLDWREKGPKARGLHRLDPDALRAGAGDFVLARRDIGAAAYHLSVVVDDAAQGVTHVVRGEDLLDATPVHRLLQSLLNFSTPIWLHHRLIRDDQGRRLAKRDDARSLAELRAGGATPADIRRLVGLEHRL